MANWTWPNWPPFVMGGWQVMPTFPSRWYHPVLGSQMVANASAFAALDSSWSPTAGLADMRRTESEAEVVIQHDINRALLNLTGGTASGTPANVNRRSAAWQAIIDRGWPGPMPLAAAQAPIGGPAPVTEGRAPGVTPPPGQRGGAQTQARTEQIPPIATATAAEISAGVPSKDPDAEKRYQEQQQMAGQPPHQQPGQPGQPGHPGQPGQPGQPQPHPQQQPGQQPQHPDHKPGEHDQPHKPGEEHRGTGGSRK